ncbi:hypothetical protein ACSHWI_14330 [Methylococcus sp. S2T]|uniref:hypothetical protein n=1 Tax=Methylococcus sp. S2T TaxID=3438967 RepID=UPI003EDB04A6
MGIQVGPYTTASSTGASLSIAKPAGIAAGDLLLLAVALDAGSFGSGAGIATPAGFTPVPAGSVSFGSNGRSQLAAFYKVASDSEPASYTLNFSAGGFPSYDSNAVVRAFGGVNTEAPVDASAGVSGGSSSSLVAPSVTPSEGESDDLLVCLWGGTAIVGASAWPAGMGDTLVANAGGGSLLMADQQLVSAVATGTRTLTASAATTWGSVSVLLLPDRSSALPLWENF